MIEGDSQPSSNGLQLQKFPHAYASRKSVKPDVHGAEWRGPVLAVHEHDANPTVVLVKR